MPSSLREQNFWQEINFFHIIDLYAVHSFIQRGMASLLISRTIGDNIIIVARTSFPLRVLRCIRLGFWVCRDI